MLNSGGKNISDEIIRQVQRVFADNPVPENYTDREHCEECAEHDDTLRAYTPETIGPDQLGNPGWDPICFVVPEAFKYYFPALVRLALDSESGNSYLDQFLFHVTYQGEESRFFSHFSKAEREITLAVLEHIKFYLSERIKDWNLEQDLDNAIKLWSNLVNQV